MLSSVCWSDRERYIVTYHITLSFRLVELSGRSLKHHKGLLLKTLMLTSNLYELKCFCASSFLCCVSGKFQEFIFLVYHA